MWRASTTQPSPRRSARASKPPSSKPRRVPLLIFQAAAHAAFRFADRPTSCQPGCRFSQAAKSGPLRFTMPMGRLSSTPASNPSPRQRARNADASPSVSNATLTTLLAMDGHITGTHASIRGA